MKKIIFFLLIYLLLHGCSTNNSSSEDKIIENFYLSETTSPNDSVRFLKKDMTLFNGNLQSSYTLFHTNLKKTESFYRFDYTNHIKKCCTNYLELGNYINGKKDGLHTDYYFKDWGNLEERLSQYIDEHIYLTDLIFLGIEDRYYNDETYSFRPFIKEKGTYKNGIKSGDFKYYNNKGNLTKEVSYLEGIENGLKKVYYDDTDKIKFTVNIKNSILEGDYKFYYKNSQLKISGKFKNNDSSGVWKSYFDDGKLESDILYEEGEIISKICFDINGNKVKCNLKNHFDDSNEKNNLNKISTINQFVTNKKQDDNYYIVQNNSKSLTNFSFKIPEGFQEYKLGENSTTLMNFKKEFDNDIISLQIMKVEDFPKYKKLSSMSQLEIDNMTISNIKNRNKNIDQNEFFESYKNNDRQWLIGGTYNLEKNLYTVMTSHTSNKQIITFVYLKSLDQKNINNISKDINMFKSLIDSFEEKIN